MDIIDRLITNNKEKKLILSETELENIQETLYLSNGSEYTEQIYKIRNSEDWKKSCEYNKDEEW